MRNSFLVLVAVIIMICQSAQAASPSPQWIKNLPAAKNSEQMVVVAGVQGSNAWISMHEKINGAWQMIMTTPGFIGSKGLGKVKEGDNKTPSGTFKFDLAFGIAPDPGCAIPYVQIGETHYWSSDNNYKYNQLVDGREAHPNFNKTISEHLIDYNPNYLYALNLGYNSEGTANKGSALFLQCFDDKKFWTGGSVAIPEAKMLFVLQHVKPGCVCVIDSLKNLGGKL